jgi:hypothetical protein
MKTLKKISVVAAAVVVFALATFSQPVKSYAFRVFTGNDCSGSGGDCLDTVCVGGGCPQQLQ